MTNEELKLAKKKYQLQIYNVEGRKRVDLNGNPIEMRLTFEEWQDIWLTSGHWHERGCRRGQYVMSRINDTGHYEIGNVEIKLARDNNREKNSSEKWQKNTREKHSKSCSCDGVIYPSRVAAGIALAPENKITTDSKAKWLATQMKKYPKRYFYI